MTRPDIEALSAAGAAKADCARTASPRYLTRAAVAGAFIFVGALLSCLSASWFCDAHPAVAKLLGAGTFSTALILIVLLGGELFTGTNLVMGVTLYEGGCSLPGALRVWGLAYVGNFLGILILCLLFDASGALQDPLFSYLQALVPAKLSAAWYMTLLKGVLCNFLVCVGVYAGFRLKSELGKMVVIALVITTFVLAGFEHSIANMAYFTLYSLTVSAASLPAMGWNLLWATVGNLLGGAVLLGLPLWCSAEGKPQKLAST